MPKILLLGSGFVAGPCAEYLARNPSNTLTVACRTSASASAFCSSIPRATPLVLDVAAADTTELEAAVAAHDLVISLVPYIYHATVIQAAIKGKTHVVTTSYISPAIQALDTAARDAGIVVLNEAGLDPGIDHLYAVKIIDEVHAKGGKVKEFHLSCGAFPAPECASTNPLQYKFSWSPRGVLLAHLNSSSFLSSGSVVEIAGADLMARAQPTTISGFPHALEMFPNRDSVPFREFYRIPEAHTVVRGTLRYAGFPAFMAALIKLGWLATDVKDWLVDGLTWAEATQRACGASGSDESALVARIVQLCTFPSTAEEERILAAMRWVGLFSSEKLVVSRGTLLDTLCARLEALMQYQPGERDLILMEQKYGVEWADGKQETIVATLEEYGTPGGTSAMARTVGVPCGIACQLVLDGVFSTPGIHAPYTKEYCDPIRELLDGEGLLLVERVL
ncbi:saccharopine dehydrogenase [Roridomyces roridus]|uniref:Saccharopine dehydrogenase n=1 Tax=Roridomyces roridus TaxID=1738132 RepID=A0AAD7C2M5_9AGAR|nr:saccharopine dehydrogenase [Roridomyces roridus]